MGNNRAHTQQQRIEQVIFNGKLSVLWGVHINTSWHRERRQWCFLSSRQSAIQFNSHFLDRMAHYPNYDWFCLLWFIWGAILHHFAPIVINFRRSIGIFFEARLASFGTFSLQSGDSCKSTTLHVKVWQSTPWSKLPQHTAHTKIHKSRALEVVHHSFRKSPNPLCTASRSPPNKPPGAHPREAEREEGISGFKIPVGRKMEYF